MDIEVLIIVALALLALPLLGNILAMMLGTLVTLRALDDERPQRKRTTWLDPFERVLRASAMRLGSWLEGDQMAVAAMQRGSNEARAIVDRRREQQRARARRRHPRSEPDRRRDDRRRNSPRRAFTLQANH